MLHIQHSMPVFIYIYFLVPIYFALCRLIILTQLSISFAWNTSGLAPWLSCADARVTTVRFVVVLHDLRSLTPHSLLVSRISMSLCLPSLSWLCVQLNSYLTAGRVRHLRRQSVIAFLVHSLLCQVNDRYTTFLVSECTGSVHDRQVLHRLDALRRLIQRWFTLRHQIVS